MGYIVPMAINFVTTPFLLKALGESAYGLQSMVAVIIGYMAFMDMGLDLPITKYLAEDRANKDKTSENNLLNTTIQLYLIIGFVGMMAIIALSKWLVTSVFKMPEDLMDQAIIVFRIAGVGFLGSVGLSWGRALTMGLQRFDITNSVTIVISSAGTLLGLAAVFAGYGVVGYILTRTIITLLAGPVYFFLSKRLLPDFSFNKGLDSSTLKRVRGFLGYGSLNRILSSLVSRLDQTLLGIWIGIAAAGIYAIPFLIMNSFNYMLSYMLGFIFPMASELKTLGMMDQLRNIFARSLKFITTMSGLTFIPTLILGDSFLKLWVPTISAQAISVLQLLCIAGYIVTIAASIPNNIMVGLGKIRQFTIYNIVRSFFLALFCFLFIRPMGLVGAGWALLASTTIDVIYFVVVVKVYIKIPSLSNFLREAIITPVLLTISIALITLILKPFATSWFGLFSIVVLIISISFPLGFLLGTFGDTEKRALQEIFLIFKKT
jgi:O-antigen/teichoic acid export membrane protein